MARIEQQGERRGRAFFRDVLAQQASSGLTLKALAEAKGIKPATLYAWSRRLRASEAPPAPGIQEVRPDLARESDALVPVRVLREPAGREEVDLGQAEVIVRGDVEVRVPACFEEASLVRLVEALRARC